MAHAVNSTGLERVRPLTAQNGGIKAGTPGRTFETARRSIPGGVALPIFLYAQLDDGHIGRIVVGRDQLLLVRIRLVREVRSKRSQIRRRYIVIDKDAMTLTILYPHGLITEEIAHLKRPQGAVVEEHLVHAAGEVIPLRRVNVEGCS